MWALGSTRGMRHSPKLFFLYHARTTIQEISLTLCHHITSLPHREARRSSSHLPLSAISQPDSTTHPKSSMDRAICINPTDDCESQLRDCGTEWLTVLRL